MKKKQGDARGFTLVELIVVLAILALLAALLIPSLSGYIQKADRQSYVAECRSLVQASQTIASTEYASGTLDRAGFLTSHDSEIWALAELAKTGKRAVTAISFAENSGRITKLIYVPVSGVMVLYQPGADPVYLVTEGTGQTGAAAYRTEWEALFNGQNSGQMWEKLESFPTLEASERALVTTGAADGFKPVPDSEADALTWKPIQVTSAKNGFVLIANTTPPGSKQNNNATLIYYSGSYYACLEYHPYQKYKYGSASVPNTFDLSQLTNAKMADYYAAHPEEITSGQKVWAKVG